MQLTFEIPELSAASRTLAIPRGRRIYCNRNLRLDQVAVVGFDMDYTLALYNQSEMDRLSVEATVRKLVDRGYPESLLTMGYRIDFPIRGLLIDRKLGNVLKMDRYRYVKKAYHGLRELSLDERRKTYHTKQLRPGTKRYHWVDTLYALSEVAVYAAVIEELERTGQSVDYDTLFTDVRTSIDLAHQDGSIVDRVREDLPRYIARDPALGPTLHKLRSAGKRLFLLTNSREAYTDALMTHLIGDAISEYPSWRHYFDVIVTASRKPGFFTGNEPFYELMPDGEQKRVTEFQRGHVYRGGNIGEFEQLLGAGGDNVLYVGDHIYGDVLRAKKDSAWRTAMIIQEMTQELGAIEQCGPLIARIDELEDLHRDLLEELHSQQGELRALLRQLGKLNGQPISRHLSASRVRLRRSIDLLKAKVSSAEAELASLELQVDNSFHPFWGSLFKAGSEVSIFGDQVEQWACLYTDRVSNFLGYSATHYFRSPRDRMPHEIGGEPGER